MGWARYQTLVICGHLLKCDSCREAESGSLHHITLLPASALYEHSFTPLFIFFFRDAGPFHVLGVEIATSSIVLADRCCSFFSSTAHC